MMNTEMGVLASMEVERLMKKVSRERTRVIRELVEKVAELEVGEELYQHFLSALPKIPELRELVNGIDPEMEFTVHETINGYIFIRIR